MIATLCLAAALAVAPASYTSEAEDDEINAMTLMALGGGFAAVGAVTVIAAAVSAAIITGAVVGLELPSNTLFALVGSAGSVAVGVGEIGLGVALIFWGRDSIRDARALARRADAPRPSIQIPVFDRDVDPPRPKKKKNPMGYDVAEEPEERRRVIED